MLAIFLATAAWLPAVAGIGHLVARRIGAAEAGLATTGLLGLGALAVFGTTLHLFAPLGPWIAAAAFLAGLASFAWNARRIMAGTHPAVPAVMVPALAGISVASDIPARHYDLGLYWLQAVKWITDSPQPLGIATLHARLGFNSSWFTVAALLEHPLAIGKSAFLAPALVLLLGAWLAAEGVVEVARSRRTFAPVLAASTALVVATCVQHLGGHSPDAAAAILGFAALVWWARALERADAFRANASVAVALAAFATTVKLSSAIWLGAVPVVLALRRDRARGDAAALALVAAAVLVPWVATGYLASGCPLFPFSVGCVSVPWATPASIAAEVSRWIRSWARAPGLHPNVVLASWDWLPGWWEMTWAMPQIRVLAVLLALGVVSLALAPRRSSPGMWALLAVSAAGVAFWFYGAPTPRFGWAYLFALALVPFAEGIARLSRRHARWPIVGAGAAALVACAALTAESVAWVESTPRSSLSGVAWPRIPRAGWREVETLAGTRVRLPLGDSDHCWSTPVPCTPYLDAGLSFDGRIFRTATMNPRHP